MLRKILWQCSHVENKGHVILIKSAMSKTDRGKYFYTGNNKMTAVIDAKHMRD